MIDAFGEKNNNFVYASNGTFKTSFSDGLSKIFNNEKIVPLFKNDEGTTYNIEIDSTKYTENEQIDVEKIKFIKFEKKLVLDIKIDKNLLSLVSIDLNKLIDKKNEILLETKPHLYKLFNKNSLARLKEGDIDLLLKECDINFDNKFIDKIKPLLKNYKYDPDLEKIEYKKIFNDKTIGILQDKDFVGDIEKYNDQIKKALDKTDKTIFNNGFTLNGLATVIEISKKEKYFDAGHKLFINNDSYSLESVEKLKEDQIREIYDSVDKKKSFDLIFDRFNKNKSLKDFIAYVTTNKAIVLPYLQDPNSLKQKMILNCLYNHADDIKLIEDKLVITKELDDKIQKETININTKWDDIIRIFNERFFSCGFSINIENIEDVKKDNTTQPSIQIKNKYGANIDDSNKQRLSTGEKRCFYILQLILEFQRLLDNEKLIIVLDDIIDSFDYKNKYAIIEYLRDMINDVQEAKINIFVLTHNFDFFKNCHNLFNDKGKFYIAKNNKGVINLENANDSFFKNYGFFKEHKKDKTIKSIIFAIPFLRNIEELTGEKNNDNEKYKTLCKYLHYRAETKYITLEEIKNILLCDAKIEINNIDLTNNYLDEIVKEIREILSNNKLSETSFMEKIILSIFLRIFNERFIYNKLLEQKIKIDIQKHWSCIGKYKEQKHFFSADEISLIEKINIIAPSFIHINAFMYEPLIDIGMDELIDVARKAIEKWGSLKN